MDHATQIAEPQIRRRSTRLTISIPVTICGKDAEGKPFTEKTHSVNVSKHGGTIETNLRLPVGAPISIENPSVGKTAQAFVVMLLEKPGPGGRLQLAVELAEPQDIWGIDFPPLDWEQQCVLFGPSAENRAPVVQGPLDKLSGAELPRPPVLADHPRRAPTLTGVAPPKLPEQSALPPAKPPRVMEEFDATLQMAVTRFVKQLEEMTEARARLIQTQLDSLADKTREELQKEFEQLRAQSLAFTKEQLRKYVRTELVAATQQLKANREMMEEEFRALREKIAAALAILGASAGKPGPDGRT